MHVQTLVKRCWIVSGNYRDSKELSRNQALVLSFASSVTWKLNDSTSWRGKVHLIFFALLRPPFVKLNLEKVVRFYFSARFCSPVAGSCIMDEDCESYAFFGSSRSFSLDGALFKRLEGRALIPELSSRAGHSSQGLRVVIKMRSLWNQHLMIFTHLHYLDLESASDWFYVEIFEWTLNIQ